MGAHNIYDQMGRALDSGEALRPDPGASGVFDLSTQLAYQSCQVKTGASESRNLPSASSMPVGAQFAVFFAEDEGDLAIGQAGAAPIDSGGNVSVTFEDEGDSAVFHVIIRGTTKEWRILAQDGGTLA